METPMTKWIEFDKVHARYWRDQRANPRPAIPVKGGDLVERDGQTFAVLYDCDHRLVAAYRIRTLSTGGERLMRAGLDDVGLTQKSDAATSPAWP
jgi:hypothetical protein